jgi:glycosyltransferase involved in cell wall biosynthesis
LKVLVIADPIVPVPPVMYGGSERIVDLMCRGLIRRGHEVGLMAGPGSHLEGGKVTLYRAPSSARISRTLRKIWFQFLILRASSRAEVIINHGRLDYLEVIYRTRKPVIHWFHNPLLGSEVGYVLQRRSRGDVFVGVSRSQISNDPAAEAFQVVPNAVDVEMIRFSPEAENPQYAVFLGRLTHNKGVHLAIDAAQQAGIKLVLAGNISNAPGDSDYFASAVKPRLGPRCEWIGPYDEATRTKLLAGATALLFPIQWQEPFGLVMVEALAAGVPVIASRRASTPEVILHGKTGFLCDSVDDMAAAIRRVPELSRSDCRASAADRFSEKPFMSRVEELLAQAATSRK